MAIPLSDNILTNAPKPSDARFGPWQSVEEACTGVPVSRRYLGLTVGILVNGVAVDYAWAIDLTDGMLLPKLGAANPGTGTGTGGSAGPGTPFSRTVTQAGTAATTYSIPGATSVSELKVYYADSKLTDPIAEDSYEFSAGTLTVHDVDLAVDDVIFGRFYTGSSTGGSGSYTDDQARAANAQAIADASTEDRHRANHDGTQDASTITGVFDAAQMPELTDADLDNLNVLLRQRGPLILPVAPLVATLIDGAFEYDGTSLYFTLGGVRKTVTLT